MESDGLPPEINEKRVRHREWLILLLALLLSFGCVFCSSGFAALTFWPDRMSPASLLAGSQADYRRDRVDGARFAALDPLVVAQAVDDMARLQLTPTGSRNKSRVVIVSLPVTPTPTPNSEPRSHRPPVSSPERADIPEMPLQPPATEATVSSTPMGRLSPTPKNTGTATNIPASSVTVTPPVNTPTALPNTPTPLPPTSTPVPPDTSTPIPRQDQDPPPSKPPTNTPIPTPTDIPAMPRVAFNLAAYSGCECDSTVAITVTLSAATGQTVIVDYRSDDINAVANNDYTPINGTLTFAPGETSHTFTVPIIDDFLDEYNEQLMVTLSNVTNAEFGSNISSTLTLVDDDPAPLVQFGHSIFSANEGDATNTSFQAELSTASAITITVDYEINDRTTDDADYSASGGNLTFLPGQTSRVFTVPVIDDADIESNEEAVLSLTNPVSATLGNPITATLVIVDNDLAGGCSGGTLPVGQPNVGPPDGSVAQIPCGADHIVDLDQTPISTHDGYDLVVYERENPSDPGAVALDWMVVQIGPGSSGPWYTVFYWGDDIPDDNTNLSYAPPEPDNMVIPMADPTPLYGTAPYTTGITIDVNQWAPAGTYQYVRIYSPAGGDNDPAEIDAIQPLP